MKGRKPRILKVLVVALLVSLARPGLASAQSSPRLKPLPPKKSKATLGIHVQAAATADSASPLSLIHILTLPTTREV
jgi:hypothetical protein